MSDPYRNVLLQRIRFAPLQGSIEDYHLYALIAPTSVTVAIHNTAWGGEYKGTPMLMAKRGEGALALARSAPWIAMSAGFVGYSDGWQDLSRNKRLTQFYRRAENGNVALVGEVDVRTTGGAFVLALGFGEDFSGAGQQSLASLFAGFDAARTVYLRDWQSWQQSLLPLSDNAGSARSVSHQRCCTSCT